MQWRQRSRHTPTTPILALALALDQVLSRIADRAREYGCPHAPPTTPLTTA
ncbi:hypothetical protein ACFVYV_24895 [Streptomyces mirabilis]|uniref:hypothetical protein n=1 Tax=Streptomyces mirabilis TaxID=68239 RepID=UPI0036D9587E